MIPVGIALCDLALNSYILARITGREYLGQPLEKLALPAVELQLEEWPKYDFLFPNDPDFSLLTGTFSRKSVSDNCQDSEKKGLFLQAVEELSEVPFRSFHGPIQCGNISSLDEQVRRQALFYVKKAFSAAEAFQSQVFVLHPCTYHWGQWEKFKPGVSNYLEFRKKSEEQFLLSLEELADYYQQNNFNFRVGLENLEFNQFPATLEEVRKLFYRSLELWEKKTFSRLGLVLDVQHLRRSLSILEENLPSPLQEMASPEELQSFLDYLHLPLCQEYNSPRNNSLSSPPTILSSFLREFGSDILLVHLGGNKDKLRSHDPILEDLRSFNYEAHHYREGRLNISQVLDTLHHEKYSGAIILEIRSEQEAHGQQFEEVVTSLANVQSYLNELC